jgi:hypothetical protein
MFADDDEVETEVRKWLVKRLYSVGEEYVEK